MKAYQLTRAAQDDLDEILDFVAVNSSYSAAVGVEQRLHAAAQSLGEFPGKGYVNDDLADIRLRIWPVHEWLIIYLPDVKPVEVVRILHGKRDVGSIMQRRP